MTLALYPLATPNGHNPRSRLRSWAFLTRSDLSTSSSVESALAYYDDLLPTFGSKRLSRMSILDTGLAVGQLLVSNGARMSFDQNSLCGIALAFIISVLGQESRGC